MIEGASETAVGRLTAHRDAGPDVDDRVVPAEAAPAHDGVVADFMSRVRDPGCWAEHDGSLALARARIIDACYRSAAERREVVL